MENIILQINSSLNKNNIKTSKNLLEVDRLISLDKDLSIFLDFDKKTLFQNKNDIKYLNWLNNCINNPEFITSLLNIYKNRNYVYKKDLKQVIDMLNLNHLKNRNLGENGCNISGGEKHKVTFARFLLKLHYSLAILDEPFTNLDVVNENQIIEVANHFLKDKMCIVISHKYKILRSLTKEVVILEKGKITQKGEHDNIKSSNNLYKQMSQNFA